MPRQTIERDYNHSQTQYLHDNSWIENKFVWVTEFSQVEGGGGGGGDYSKD